ncbi:MAG: RagB/SusD family nutrient uptake outer membrane protein [Bacteroidales bacterium]|nr:RagB/SusD family nutrient uptake outer membrane protein [Bacteroidales bacterium]
MKKIIFSITVLAALAGLSACNSFLELPEVTGSVYLETVFSNRKDAEGMLWRTYHKALREGLPEGWGINHGTLASISGELSRGFTWHGTYPYTVSGPAIIPNSDGNIITACNFDENWEVIRSAFLVIQNIDSVPADELSDAMKSYMKGEAYGLIAYRYMTMFQRWGGVPKAVKAYAMDDDINLPRKSVEETLAYILELCQKAYDLLPDSWYDIEPGSADKWDGRLTKGVILAIKAKALTFAARPLFNSEKSYAEKFNMSGADNFDKSFISFGNYDPQRYKDAIDANLAVLEWCKNNGKGLIFTAGEGNVNSFEQAIDDYGRGVSDMYGAERILSFKVASTQSTQNNMNMGYNWSAYGYTEELSQRGILTNFLRLYRDRDGNDIDWPVVGESAPRDISDFGANIDKIEARFRVDVCVPGKFGRSNDGDPNWNENISYMGSFETDEANAANMIRSIEGRGIGVPTKFFYKAGARQWFEFPIFRVAENYLHLAEAYNETGDPANARKYLNIIRGRAGLPAVQTSDKAELRELIVRENALEFFEENHRYFDVKHWMLDEIGTEILGGPKTEISILRIGSNNTMDALVSYWDAFAFNQYWHPKMFLEPFNQSEVNKGIIAQNPGY